MGSREALQMRGGRDEWPTRRRREDSREALQMRGGRDGTRSWALAPRQSRGGGGRRARDEESYYSDDNAPPQKAPPKEKTRGNLRLLSGGFDRSDHQPDRAVLERKAKELLDDKSAKGIIVDFYQGINH